MWNIPPLATAPARGRILLAKMVHKMCVFEEEDGEIYLVVKHHWTCSR
jgi:hypothetical protein